MRRTFCAIAITSAFILVPGQLGVAQTPASEGASTVNPTVSAPVQQPAMGKYATLIARSNAMTPAQREQAKNLIGMGVELQQGKNCKAALKALQQGLDIDPVNATGNYYFAICSLMGAEPGSQFIFYDYMKRAATLGSPTKETFAAQTTIDQFDGRFREKIVKEEIQLGKAASGNGKHADAILHFSNALEVQPGNADAAALMAKVRVAKVDSDQAMASANQAVQANAGDPMAYYNRGALRMKRSEYDAAIADFDQAIKLKPDLTKAYSSRASAYSTGGDYDRAIADYDKSIQLDSKSASPYLGRGWTYWKKGDLEHARTDLDKAVQLDTKSSGNFYWRGRVRYDQKEYSRAVTDFDKAVALTPDDAESYRMRAATKLQMAEYDGASEDYSKYIDLAPEEWDGYYWRAVSYWNASNESFFPADYWRKALVDFNRTLELKSDNADAYAGRGYINWYLDNVAIAKSDCETALRLNPNSATAKSCLQQIAAGK